MNRPTPLNAQALLGLRWQAAPETTIGGWCLQPEGEPPTHEGGVSIADFLREEHARYMAGLHNDQLARVAANRAAELRE